MSVEMSMDAGAYLARRAELVAEIAEIDAQLRRIVLDVEQTCGRTAGGHSAVSAKLSPSAAFYRRRKAAGLCVCGSALDVRQNGVPYARCRPCLDKLNARMKAFYRAKKATA